MSIDMTLRFATLAAENDRLQKEVARITAERDALKAFRAAFVAMQFAESCLWSHVDACEECGEIEDGDQRCAQAVQLGKQSHAARRHWAEVAQAAVDEASKEGK